MKKAFLLSIMFLFGALISFAQFEPGTLESLGQTGSRGITANGLTSLYSATGNFVLSADAAGGYPLSAYNVSVNKPTAGATVHQAYLFGTPTANFISAIPNGCVTLAGSPINWDGSAPNTFGTSNSYADVTAIVSPTLNAAGAGISNLAVTECNTTSIDGVALLVIFQDAAYPQKTIIIMFGGLSSQGDNFALTLAQPIDPMASGALLNMGLGIEFGFQGTGQFSIINVNGNRLTSAAGGADDAVDSQTNGNLITLGGVGDSNGNPADPFAGPLNHYSDDELYSLLPFITNTTTNILVTTSNPSNDDNVFLAHFEISGAAIIGEGILLTQEEDVNPVGTNHTVTAHVQNDLGDPVVNTLVTFEVLSGPNAGETFSAYTNAAGEALFTYLGDGGPGIDHIQACFINSQQQEECSNILEKTWQGQPTNVPLSDWAVVIGIMLIVAFVVFRFRRIS